MPAASKWGLIVISCDTDSYIIFNTHWVEALEKSFWLAKHAACKIVRHPSQKSFASICKTNVGLSKYKCSLGLGTCLWRDLGSIKPLLEALETVCSQYNPINFCNEICEITNAPVPEIPQGWLTLDNERSSCLIPNESAASRALCDIAKEEGFVITESLRTKVPSWSQL